jgi:hypothetical protein
MAGYGHIPQHLNYRRRKQAREQAALVIATAAREAVLDRLAYQLAELRACLDRAAQANAVMAGELRM